MKNKYYGVFDYKESDTFRQTIEERIHKDYPYAKTLCTRSDSCCVMIGGYSMENLRIRKLTPKECFRLMGMKDEDIEKVMKHQTNAKAYHLAGDSIVTTCLMGIFGEMLGIDWKEKFNPKEWWKIK
jgi:site-specific DNA-cytosine methylase